MIFGEFGDHILIDNGIVEAIKNRVSEKTDFDNQFADTVVLRITSVSGNAGISRIKNIRCVICPKQGDDFFENLRYMIAQTAFI